MTPLPLRVEVVRFAGSRRIWTDNGPSGTPRLSPMGDDDERADTDECRRQLNTDHCAATEIDQLPGEPWLWAREEASVERGGLGGDPAVASLGAVADCGGRAGVGGFAEHSEVGVGL